MVARQTAPGCTWCVRMEKGSARTKRARAEAPRTGVYVISAWNVRGTGRTGCNRAQGSFFADAYYNKGNHIAEQPETAQPSGGASETHDVPSIEEGGQLDIPTLPSSYCESQKGIGEWIDRAETFSPTSRARFQKWAKGTEILLAQAELQQQSYHNVHA